MEAETKNPIPSDEQEPSEKAAAQISERVEDFRKKVHEQHEGHSDFDQGEVVEIGKSAEFDSIASGQVRDAKGRKGRVVGQAYVAPEESRHAGKVCRGVMLDNGELITTPEEKLVRPSKSKVSFASVSQERWDAIFGKKKEERRKNQ